MKTVTTLFSLNPQMYSLNGLKEEISFPSIVAITEDNRNSKLVNIGLAVMDNSRFNAYYAWSPGNSCDLIQLYRALLLLRYCRDIQDDTLCACYYVASTTPDTTAKSYVKALEESGVKNVVDARAKVLRTSLNYGSLDKIIKNATCYHVKFISNEHGSINAIAS